MNLPKNAVPVLMEKPEPQIRIDQLEESDHVGFIDSGNDKGYISCITAGDEFESHYVALDNSGLQSYGNQTSRMSFKDALQIKNRCHVDLVKVYKFSTRRDLYSWLAQED